MVTFSLCFLEQRMTLRLHLNPDKLQTGLTVMIHVKEQKLFQIGKVVENSREASLSQNLYPKIKLTFTHMVPPLGMLDCDWVAN